MSQPNILELIKDAPVEWKSLWEVTIWDKKFNGVERHKQPKVIKYHYYLAKELHDIIDVDGDIKILTTSPSDLWAASELVEGNISEGEIVAIPWGGNPVVQYFKGRFITTDNRIATSNDTQFLDNKFLYYFLLSQIGAISSFYRGSGIKHPSMADVLELQIPIPSLDIQQEIVRILDTMTAVTSELTSELIAREKQYNYYRDQLLSFDENEVEWANFGNDTIFHVSSGGTPKTSTLEYWQDGKIAWLKSESCENRPVHHANHFITELGLKNSSAKLLPQKTTLIALVGATIFKTAFLEFEAATNQNIASIKSVNENIILDKFVFYYLTNQYEKLKESMRNYGMLNLTTLRSFSIPIPPLEKQARIVAILDKFDTLTNSISQGLPREIELRQKQYEYYRDLLLSFPKPELEEAVSNG